MAGHGRLTLVVATGIAAVAFFSACGALTPCNPLEACIHQHDVTYTNETDDLLFVLVGDVRGGPIGPIFPGETLPGQIFTYDSRGGEPNSKDDPIAFWIYDQWGCPVHHQTLTVNQVQDSFDSELVLTSADIAPKDERLDCAPDRVVPAYLRPYPHRLVD